jgi:PAS domain-containing protein
MKVLNAFQIDYLVIHDVDPINDDEEDERKKKHRAEMFKYNQKIAETLDPSFGNIVSINPEFDELLGVPRHQVERFGKRFAVFSRCNEIALEEIPEELKGIVRNCVPDIQE